MAEGERGGIVGLADEVLWTILLAVGCGLNPYKDGDAEGASS
jgi:hypothetical protein